MSNAPVKRWTAKRKVVVVMDVPTGRPVFWKKNRKPVQRLLPLKSWQVHTRPQDFRPHVRSLSSATSQPDERWATDQTHVWCGNGSAGQPRGKLRLLHA